MRLDAPIKLLWTARKGNAKQMLTPSTSSPHHLPEGWLLVQLTNHTQATTSHKWGLWRWSCNTAPLLPHVNEGISVRALSMYRAFTIYPLLREL
ncbi:hypothetical protein CBOM_07484 [Ceraceosorus bombacis]|uniref:Uncharacterized protein n=1 Tax=Ceraceosorus bombacis TaxID=401625 RepID=A0A0P1BET2_9BASI|nr:hypothetical protein CBOM_07484 [Ceraceosorus bombacis]